MSNLFERLCVICKWHNVIFVMTRSINNEYVFTDIPTVVFFVVTHFWGFLRTQYSHYCL